MRRLQLLLNVSWAGLLGRLSTCSTGRVVPPHHFIASVFHGQQRLWQLNNLVTANFLPRFVRPLEYGSTAELSAVKGRAVRTLPHYHGSQKLLLRSTTIHGNMKLCVVLAACALLTVSVAERAECGIIPNVQVQPLLELSLIDVTVTCFIYNHSRSVAARCACAHRRDSHRTAA